MPTPGPQHERDFVDAHTNSDLIGPEYGGPARPRRAHRPGEDPLPAGRLEEIRAAADSSPELRDVLGELDRIQPLLDSTLAANGVLLDQWARYAGVAPHPFLGVFCRTCRAEVQPGMEGCPRHDPTVIGRALYRMHDENRTLPDAERNRRAYELLDAALPLLAAVLNPVDHKEGCRLDDCRCGCDRRQDCPDCHRCVCWRSECCEEKAARWRAEDRWAQLTAAVGPEDEELSCGSMPGCDGECCKSAPVADEDAQRAARRAGIRIISDRLALGMTTPEEGADLRRYVDAEIREHDTMRAVAAGNLRHVRTIVPELQQAQAVVERMRAVRDNWRGMTLEPGQVRRLLDDVTAALDGAGPHAREHGRTLVEFQTVIARMAWVLQEAETHRKEVSPEEWQDCPGCGRDHAAEALSVIRGTGAPSVDVLADCAQLTRERDGWQRRAGIAETELRTLRAGIRALGGDPTQVQNLWAQLHVRNRQWADAKRERDGWAGRCGEAEAGEDIARRRAERAAAALGDVLGMFRPVKVNGAVAFYQAPEHPIRPDQYAWWADARAAAVRPEEGPRCAVCGHPVARHAGRICERPST